MFDLLTHISKVNSPEMKRKHLLAYPYQEELKTVLKLATDPFITFGITDFSEGVAYSYENPYYVLNQLANRELTGGAAKAALGGACADLDDTEKEVIRRILRKDLRCGVGEKTVAFLYPGLIQQFGIMRAQKFEKLAVRGHYFIEPKYDGLRCIAAVKGRSVKLLSRNGLEFTSSEHLKEPILKLIPRGTDGFFDGELTSGNFNQSSSAVRKKAVQNESTVFNVFDFLDVDEWKNPVRPYYQRRNILEGLYRDDIPGIVLTPSYEVKTDAEVFSYYEKFLDLKYEGGIIKNAKGLYRFRKHRDWLKLKEQQEVDLVVESLVEGEGKYKGMLGAAIVKYHGKRVSVGSGWSDDERDLYWKNPQLLLRKVIEIHFHQVTPDGSLRHPRFHRIREDKSVMV